MRAFFDNLRAVVYAILFALILRTFLFQPFSIPSGSMIPTLMVGDFLFVSKFAYGYSRHSFPFDLASFPGRKFGAAPERGDVAVFKLPSDNETDFIKRVIGLPGEKIQVRGGVVYIDGEPVERRRIADYVMSDRHGGVYRIPRYRERLPNGVEFEILDRIEGGISDDTPVFSVPEGSYFVMGDNRDDSTDSRFRKVGFIPEQNLVGEAQIIFFSIDRDVFADQSLLQSFTRWNFVRWPRIAETL